MTGKVCENRVSFNWRILIPPIALIIILLVHQYVPVSPQYRLKELPYFSYFLYLLLGIFAFRGLISLFHGKERQKLTFSSWLFGIAFRPLRGGLNYEREECFYGRSR
jgi:surface polysaccharide O-acyltransferase-like enzyme